MIVSYQKKDPAIPIIRFQLSSMFTLETILLLIVPSDSTQVILINFGDPDTVTALSNIM